LAAGRNQTLLGGCGMNPTNGKSPGTGHAGGSKTINTTLDFTDNALVSQHQERAPMSNRIWDFPCAGCRRRGTPLGGRVTATGLVGKVCKPCSKRAANVLVHRLAYALGIPAEIVGQALAASPPMPAGCTYMDEVLGLRPGQYDEASTFAVGPLFD